MRTANALPTMLERGNLSPRLILTRWIADQFDSPQTPGTSSRVPTIPAWQSRLFNTTAAVGYFQALTSLADTWTKSYNVVGTRVSIHFLVQVLIELLSCGNELQGNNTIRAMLERTIAFYALRMPARIYQNFVLTPLGSHFLRTSPLRIS